MKTKKEQSKKLLQNEKDQKQKMQKVVTNSKMQNNADHLISLWTHMYWSV